MPGGRGFPSSTQGACQCSNKGLPVQAPQPQGQDVAAQLQSMLAQAALVQQLQAHQSAHSQLMQLLQLNQLVQGSSPDPSGERHAAVFKMCNP